MIFLPLQVAFTATKFQLLGLNRRVTQHDVNLCKFTLFVYPDFQQFACYLWGALYSEYPQLTKTTYIRTENPSLVSSTFLQLLITFQNPIEFPPTFNIILKPTLFVRNLLQPTFIHRNSISRGISKWWLAYDAQRRGLRWKEPPNSSSP